ncbi:MAG: RNA-binding protein [Flavobacteriales bacterium]|nr:RNA-binding protein [Flavobacteriales bacterium]
MMEFKLDNEYIELIKLLKACGIAETGGMAKQMVEEGLVKCNGIVEDRKRLKVKKGDLVEFEGDQIHIV